MREEVSNGRRLDVSGLVRRIERILLANIVPFWLGAIDEARGGYLIGHDHLGRPRPEPGKGLVSQARQLWLFARLAGSGYGRPEHLAAARHGYRFLRERLWDAEYGGFHWEVGAEDGRPRRSGKHLYGQAFALYALAAYYRTSRDESARGLAETCLDLITAKGGDPRYGGYVEVLTRDWRPEVAGTMGYLGVAAGIRTINAHLHIFEAMVAWHRVVPSAASASRLEALFDLLAGWVTEGSGDQYTLEWRPLGPALVSYGHHLESLWMLLDAADSLGKPVTPVLAGLRGRFLACLESGYDFRSGGFFEYGPESGRAAGRDKVWWVQAEALLACLNLHRATGAPFYLAMFDRILNFIETRQADWRHGEWHARLTPSGPAREAKSHFWKAGYHSGRAMIESLALLEQGHPHVSPG